MEDFPQGYTASMEEKHIKGFKENEQERKEFESSPPVVFSTVESKDTKNM